MLQDTRQSNFKPCHQPLIINSERFKMEAESFRMSNLEQKIKRQVKSLKELYPLLDFLILY